MVSIGEPSLTWKDLKLVRVLCRFGLVNIARLVKDSRGESVWGFVGSPWPCVWDIVAVAAAIE